VKADISQFYPSLYTHAVGWAIDPKLRERKHWNNTKLLGKQIDQALMDLQGKVSQGMPIGPDLSFLLAELVLSQIDNLLKLNKGSAYRWFDDYEIACASRGEAEETIGRLVKLVDSYKLRLNLAKTRIIELPSAAGDIWQDELLSRSRSSLSTPGSVVAYFDHALRLRAAFPDSPVLMYAVGVLFRLTKPQRAIHQVAQSYMLQSLVSEPGCAQKVFALLSYWELNGVPFDRGLVTRTIGHLAGLHQSRGVSSDLVWAIAFALQHSIPLPKRLGVVASEFDDDAIAIEVLHAHSVGLLPNLNVRRIERALAKEACEGAHWLAMYEGVRQGFLKNVAPVVQSDKFFAALLAAKVSFYRTQLPPYALLIHPGGAPDGVVRVWIKGGAQARKTRPAAMGADVAKLSKPAQLSGDDIVRSLLERLAKRGTQGTSEPYS
jgi:hypothetical protein